LALEQGFIFTSMVLAAVTVAVIERKFAVASVWCGIAALLSMAGLMHSYQWSTSDTVMALVPAWPWVLAYAAMGIIFGLARWVTVSEEK
jgi:AGZA family xanthine/uracil permease-like MFS transporter